MYRYIGNKTAIIDPVMEILLRKSGVNESFADPMCGTASVSTALAAAGRKVIAGDILTFPTFHAVVRLAMSEAPSFSGLGLKYSEVLEVLNKCKPHKGYFTKEYSEGGKPNNGSSPRKYLTKENAMLVDAITICLNSWHSDGAITTRENQLLRHDLIMAVNRVANIAGTYGHYRSTFSKASMKKLEMLTTSFNEFATDKNSVVCGPSELTVPKMKADILYLDPPYKKRQYAANYHLLETLALGDFPEPVGLSGLRDWWPNYSDFCSKRKIEEAFHATLSGNTFNRIFVSYSEDGLIAEDQMTKILANYGEVQIHKFKHKRFKSNNSELSNTFFEFIFEIETR
jgi:adenine-specific DNA-methyltransferase